MQKIIECVPNFSEGRDQEIINAIADAIRNTPGVTLLDVDPGRSTNRTVYTFVGSPSAIVEGALSSARVAYKLIDMRKHKGEHPRMGAMDVCPFVPVSNVTLSECVECSNEFARRASAELGVPFYLYEEAQTQLYRKHLPDIRQGEYEGLAKRIITSEWKPDFGPAEFVSTWGATVTGARFFLIAYNVNILGTSNQAHRIALDLREAGRGENERGRLKETKGLGWYVDEYNMAQVSMNLTNYKVTPIHTAFEEVKKVAKELNVGVAGSELIGLVPLEAMLMTADYYIQAEDLMLVDEKQKITLVVERLGLNSISKFDPSRRIIEYMIQENNEPLASLTLRGFIEEVANRSSAPGGGSASAAIASIGVGLGCMVGQLTYGIRKFEYVDKEIRSLIPPLYNSVQKLIPMIDADTNAFNDYMEALRLPKNTDEEKQIRSSAMQEGLKQAIQIPLATMCYVDEVWGAMIEVAKYGNIASKSDVEVGARAMEMGIWGAYKNVIINLKGIKDINFVNTTNNLATQIVERAKEKMQEVLQILDDRDKK
jgi:glutamate formiminotransferase/formiminotetrahydrofolate cyclodeaminase